MTPQEVNARSWPYKSVIDVDYRVVRPHRRLGLVLGFIFCLGLNGFIPSGDVGLTMPLWFAFLLTIVGGAGIYFLRDRC